MYMKIDVKDIKSSWPDAVLLISRNNIREIEGFATHICITKKMRLVFRKDYIYATLGQDVICLKIKYLDWQLFFSVKIVPGTKELKPFVTNLEHCGQ